MNNHDQWSTHDFIPAHAHPTAALLCALIAGAIKHPDSSEHQSGCQQVPVGLQCRDYLQ